MGKSAKLLKRPTKKEKVVIKSTKKTVEPEQAKHVIKEAKKTTTVLATSKFHPYAKPESKSNSGNSKNQKKSNKRILEGRPDYVDLMYGRPKAKNA